MAGKTKAFVRTWDDAGETCCTKVFARLSWLTDSQVRSFCKRGMPHKKTGPQGVAVDVAAAREWLQTSPFANDKMVSLIGLSKATGTPYNTLKQRRGKDGWLPPAYSTPDGKAWYCLDDLPKFYEDFKKVKNRDRPKIYPGPNADPTSHAYLYEIRDPKDGQCIYVGFSKNAKARISQHKSNLNQGRHSNRQLQNLHNARNGKLKYKVVAEGMSQLILDLEKRAIAELRAEIGDRLCNATDGGDGFDSLPEKTKRAMSVKASEKWRDDDYRKRWYASQGKPFVSYQDSVLDKLAKACKAVQWACDMAKPKPKPKPKPDYTKDDLVLPTVGDAILFPAVRDKAIYWCSIDATRRSEVEGHNWCIVSHNKTRYRLKRSGTGGIHVTPKKPYSIPGHSCPSRRTEHIEYTEGCPRCGAAFVSRADNQVYCSLACAGTMAKRRARQRQQASQS